MQEIKFNNLIMSNAGTKNSFFISHIEGLESGSVKRQEIEYIDTDGVKFKDIYFEPRIVTVEGYILSDSKYAMLDMKKSIIKAFNPKKQADFYYRINMDQYYAPAYADSLPEFGLRIGWFLPFTIYININGFYLLSPSEINIPIYQVTKNLKTTFELPCVFSNRIAKSVVYNDGDDIINGMFTLIGSKYLENVTISIKNNTTGHQFVIQNFTLEMQEIITIDFENGTCSSNIKGNIITFVSSNSEFFPLILGENEIECDSDDVDLLIKLTFRKKYLGI